MRAYLGILRSPRMPALLGSMLLARLPIGINALATVLFVRAEGGSFARAGLAAGALALGSALGAPVGARLVDRLGPRVLLALAGLHAAGLLAVIAVGSAAAPAAALVAVALVAGLALPPVSSVLRALYPRLFGHDPALLQGAYALDSVLTEVIFVAGPLLTAVLMALIGPAAALVLSAAAVTSGVAAFLLVLPPAPAPAADRSPAPARRLAGALASRGVRTLVGAMLPVGFALGALEVAVPAFAEEQGRAELAGLLIAIWAAGSAVGGLAYGARVRRATLADVHVRMALLVPLSFLPVALAGSSLAMALLLVPAGLFIAPLIATRNELAGVVAPAGAQTEAFTWPLTALVSGIALGAAAAGALVEVGGWRTAVLAGAAAAGLGAAVSLTRRASLGPPVGTGIGEPGVPVA